MITFTQPTYHRCRYSVGCHCRCSPLHPPHTHTHHACSLHSFNCLSTSLTHLPPALPTMRAALFAAKKNFTPLLRAYPPWWSFNHARLGNAHQMGYIIVPCLPATSPAARCLYTAHLFAVRGSGFAPLCAACSHASRLLLRATSHHLDNISPLSPVPWHSSPLPTHTHAAPLRRSLQESV